MKRGVGGEGWVGGMVRLEGWVDGRSGEGWVERGG